MDSVLPEALDFKSTVPLCSFYALSATTRFLADFAPNTATNLSVRLDRG